MRLLFLDSLELLPSLDTQNQQNKYFKNGLLARYKSLHTFSLLCNYETFTGTAEIFLEIQGTVRGGGVIRNAVELFQCFIAPIDEIYYQLCGSNDPRNYE